MSIFKKIGGMVSAAKANVDEINSAPSGAPQYVPGAAMTPLELPPDYDDGERYFTFWHVKGEVYGLQKWNEIDHLGTFSITEFFMRTGEDDAHVRLEGADVPVADGQTACVIFGHALEAKIGFPLRYLNAQMRRGWISSVRTLRLRRILGSLAMRVWPGYRSSLMPICEMR